MHVTKLIIIPVAVFTAAAAAAPQLRIGPWRKINRPVKAELESQIDLSDMKGHTVDKREAKRPGDRWGYNEAELDGFGRSKSPPVINSTESAIHPRWFWGNSPKKPSYPNRGFDHYHERLHKDHWHGFGCNSKHPNPLLDNFRNEGRSVPFDDTEHGLLNEATEKGGCSSCSCNDNTVAATLDDNENDLADKATDTSASELLPREKICETCGWDHEEGSPKPSRNPSIASISSRSTVPVDKVMDLA